MIETTVLAQAQAHPPVVQFVVNVSLFDAKCAITDSQLRDALAQRVSAVAADAVWAYFNSPEGRDEVWALDNSLNGAATPTATPPQ